MQVDAFIAMLFSVKLYFSSVLPKTVQNQLKWVDGLVEKAFSTWTLAEEA